MSSEIERLRAKLTFFGLEAYCTPSLWFIGTLGLFQNNKEAHALAILDPRTDYSTEEEAIHGWFAAYKKHRT